MSIDNNHSVVVSAPTGSGKTLIADYIINKYLKKGIKVIYTAPIKALSNQKYKEFSTDYGEENVGLLTGDIVINPGGQVLIMTTEIYRNMVLSDDELINSVSYVVFDEIHYINDVERGYVWEESIIFSKPHVRFLCLSATIPNAREFASWINSIKNHPVDTVTQNKRPVPLYKKFFDSELGIASLEEIREVENIPDYHYVTGRSRHRAKPPSHIELIKDIKDKLPCFFFHFSRQGCQNFALELAKARIFEANPTLTSFMRKRLESAPPEVKQLKSTRTLMEVLPYGIGFHHAGLIPVVKGAVEELFSKGMIKVLYTTETFAVGINMPAKTVCFSSLRKYDGINFRSLNSKEYFQIAGRAGRRGIDKKGFAYALVDRKDFDYKMLKNLTDSDTEPIRSQFRLSVNTVLNLIKQHNQEEIDSILKMSFYTYQKLGKGEIKNAFNNIKKKLVKLGYVIDEKLTYKGEFVSKIYSDEIIIGEIFSTKFHEELNEYQIMLVIACLCFEPREKTEFYIEHPSKFSSDLKKMVYRNHQVSMEKRFNNIDEMTAIIHLCYHGQDIFKILKNTNLVEGDIIRFFRQMLDKISQIMNSTEDRALAQKLKICKELIISSLSDIDQV